MQKFLISLLTPIIENVFKKLFKFIANEIKEINQVRKDKKLMNDIKKDDNAKNRSKRLKDFINK